MMSYAGIFCQNRALRVTLIPACSFSIKTPISGYTPANHYHQGKANIAPGGLWSIRKRMEIFNRFKFVPGKGK